MASFFGLETLVVKNWYAVFEGKTMTCVQV